MIRFLKILCLLLTILSTILFLCCIFCRFSYIPFNSAEVKNNIRYYSSEKFKGRLCGSIENDEVKENLKSFIEKYNNFELFPNYEENFSATVPVQNDENSILKVTDNLNSVIKEYKLGKDYKEDLLNFRSSSLNFNKTNDIHVMPNSIIIKKDNKNFLLYISQDNNFTFRSSFINSSEFEFAVQITLDTYNSLLEYISHGYNISINLPYKLCSKNISNIACVIKGTSNELPPLILCAHYDHVGYDSLGTIYPGALDNASGTSFLISLLKTLSSLPSPKRDIIFVALNGEEFDLLGSKQFAKDYENFYDISNMPTVINFDMIGAKDYDISLIKSNDCEGKHSNILDNLENICNKKNIPYNIQYEDSSDHASFECSKFDSITICQSDMSNIHTPRDTYEKISTNDINKVFAIIYPQIITSCYNTNKLFFYKNSTLIILTLTTSILVSSSILFFKKQKEV